MGTFRGAKERWGDGSGLGMVPELTFAANIVNHGAQDVQKDLANNDDSRGAKHPSGPTGRTVLEASCEKNSWSSSRARRDRLLRAAVVRPLTRPESPQPNLWPDLRDHTTINPALVFSVRVFPTMIVRLLRGGRGGWFRIGRGRACTSPAPAARSCSDA